MKFGIIKNKGKDFIFLVDEVRINNTYFSCRNIDCLHEACKSISCSECMFNEDKVINRKELNIKEIEI